MSVPSRSSSLWIRLGLFAVLAAAEALAATFFLDGATPAPPGSWLAVFIHVWGPSVARFGIAFLGIFATFTWLRYQLEIQSLSAAEIGAIRWSFAGLHVVALATFGVASASVYGDHLRGIDPTVAASIWMFSVAAVVASGGLAFLPWQVWSSLRRATGSLWFLAAAAGGITLAATSAFRSLWRPASRITFQMVQLFLSPFVSNLVVQPEELRIGTHHFTVIIADQCSGLEGIGLLLVFGVMWLLLFRHELKLPQALILLPLGVVTLFLMNAMRLTALILIGNAGAREIAAQGFHSQAGWIAFNTVAFGSCVLARRWSWVSSVPAASIPAIEGAEAAETTAFLAPFLAILAAGMLSHAASGAFEWLYPIRVLAALGVVWFFRRSYALLDWRCGLLAPLAGVAVFLLWIAAQRGSGGAMPLALAAAPLWLRIGWISVRFLGAAVTVPLAEELAFRGFLLRRLVSKEFNLIRFEDTTWLAIAGSSILFGFMHGPRWWLGAIAGAVYALIIRKSGRIGDAVVAHAVTNALLGFWVLHFGQWSLW